MVKLTDVRSPQYVLDAAKLIKWREAVEAGDTFVHNNLQRLVDEDTKGYFDREKITPVPAYIKAALREILTSIYPQMYAVSRQDGPKTFQTAMQADIDGSGTSLNYFLVMDVLREVLVAKRVAICIDRARLPEQPSLSESDENPPYAYVIPAENVLAWDADSGSVIPTEILIRISAPVYHEGTSLLTGTEDQYRHMKQEGDFVSVATYDKNGKSLTVEVLNLKQIPVVLLEIEDSIVQDVVGHQVTILNLMSSTMAYAIGANLAVYTEQADLATLMASLRNTSSNIDEDDTVDNDDVAAHIRVGNNMGRRYAQGSERPQFISPDTKNLPEMMSIIEKLRDDIRRIMLLALQNVSVRGLMTVTALTQSQASTNHGLAVLAVMLEKAERAMAVIWANFEGVDDTYKVKYPNDFQLMSAEERAKHIENLSKMQGLLPSETYRGLIAEQMVVLVLNQQLTADVRSKIEKELEAAPSLVLQPELISQLVTEGVLPREYAATLLNLPTDAAQKANDEHADRLQRISEAQAAAKASDGSNVARGNTDGENDGTGAFEKRSKE